MSRRNAGYRIAWKACADWPDYDAAKRRTHSGTADRRRRRWSAICTPSIVGQKRFSLEGGETLIPLLDHLLQRAGEQGVKETVIGMAHRGRLNVLVNMLGKLPPCCLPNSKASIPSI